MPNKPNSAPGNLVVNLDGIGMFGPGFSNWPMASAVLAGLTEYIPQQPMLKAPALLPTAERRRTSKPIMLALTVGLEAVEHAGISPSNLRTVFAASNGDGYTCHEICSTLASDDRQISPTKFHNSVNNATAGYWSIATKSMAPAYVLSGFDTCFGAGLLEAAVQVILAGEPVLLIAYDVEYPEPLRSQRPDVETFGVAMVLSPIHDKKTLARLEISITTDQLDQLGNKKLEHLRLCNPVARSLPLLEAIAKGDRKRIVIDYQKPSGLSVELYPCT